MTLDKVKKKYALNNSYFKYRSANMPSNPNEVAEYVEQHNELPYNSELNDNWLYDCYIEFQKRVGVVNSQFFTPPDTARRVAEIVSDLVPENERILDACCGFGQLTKAMQKEGFNQIEAFDFSSSMTDLYYSYTGLDARLYDFRDKDKLLVNKYETIVANPPYETKELIQFFEFLNDYLYANGKAILLLPHGFLDKTSPAKLVVSLNGYAIEHRELMTEDFARTKSKAEIVVLRRI